MLDVRGSVWPLDALSVLLFFRRNDEWLATVEGSTPSILVFCALAPFPVFFFSALRLLCLFPAFLCFPHLPLSSHPRLVYLCVFLQHQAFLCTQMCERTLCDLGLVHSVGVVLLGFFQANVQSAQRPCHFEALHALPCSGWTLTLVPSKCTGIKDWTQTLVLHHLCVEQWLFHSCSLLVSGQCF